MHIERGAVIADRYVVSAVERPWLADDPTAGSVCLALDAILDETVIVYAAQADLAGNVLDAGRRLALVTDPRVPRVTDVGSDGEVAYVVCSRTSATSLARILREGPLSADAARAVIGELSEVLAHAASRGLHHLCLGPESIGITEAGDLVVHGIAVDAALSEAVFEIALAEGPAALREDSLAIVDILYAVLTAQWPREEDRAGLPAAPRKNTRVVPAESLRDDIPEDLMSLVTGVTSGVDPGPRSPAEIIRFLEDWDRSALEDLRRAPAATEEELLTGAIPIVSDADDAADSDDAAHDSGSAEPGTGASADSSSPSQPSGSTSDGAGSGGARPTMAASPAGAAPARKPSSPAPAAAATGSKGASQAQMQRALSRMGLLRPGVSGLAAGRADGVSTQHDDRLAMARASVFPISGDSLSDASEDEWSPEDALGSYDDLSAQEEDRNLTMPILDRSAYLSDDSPATREMTREELFGEASEAEDDQDDDGDGSWFLGGMFETREQQFAQQRAAFNREREAERRRTEDARRRVEEAERRRAEASADAPGGDLAPPAESSAAAAAEQPSSGDDSGSGAAAVGAGLAAGAGAAAASAAAGASAGEADDSDGRAAAASGADAERGDSVSSDVSEEDRAAIAVSGAGAGGAGLAGAAQSAGAAPEKRSSRRRLLPILIGAVVVLAVVLGLTFALGGGGDDQPVGEATATAEPTEEPAEEPTEEPPAPPVLASAEDLDPEGDGEENSDSVDEVLSDGGGMWRSDRYKSAEFGGLKAGLGIGLELEETTTVSAVTIDSPSEGATVEIRSGDGDPEDAEVLGEGDLGDGETTVELSEPVETDSLVVWVTKLAPEGDGYRIEITQISLS